MLRECLDALRVEHGGTFVDATLGGGGHTGEILGTECLVPGASDTNRQAPGTRHPTVIAFDADEVAIERAQERFADVLGERLFVVHANFRTMAEHLAEHAPIDGALFDLGVSSFQFDHHERGFSYRQEAPLDMRFTPEGETAADLLNTRSEDEIIRILREYGEDPSARKLAAAIIRRRTLAPYRTTIDLRDTIVQHIPPQHHNKTLARVFQALRIAVNDELGALQQALLDVIPFCRQGARLVVMSYHSLEDQIVKDTFKSDDRLKILTKKPVMASAEEVAGNPRARSARLRVAETVVPPSYLSSR